MNCVSGFSCATALLCAASTSFAGTFSSDFNSGTTAPPGTTVNGSTVIESTGGVNNSGVLKLTKAINNQSGSFVINDLDAGNTVYGFDLTAKVRVGGGTATPADGFSINFDPTATPETTTGEEGTAGGITFAFDIYDNTNENPPAPSIDLKVGGAVVATKKMSIADFDTGADFVDLHIQIAADGAASLAYKGNILFTNVYFSTYQPLSGASFVFGGRTGGLNDNQWFDDVSITTYTQPRLGISQQPKTQTVMAGTDVVLSVAANNADGATYQWLRNGTAVAGGTNPTLTIPAITAADDGAKYTVQVTGANNTVTSQEAVLTVKQIALPATPAVTYDFNDGATPANTIVAGTAFIVTNGGVNDSGVLQVTTDSGGQAGAFIIPDLNSGAAVYGVTAEFDVLLRSLATPADGFSFSFASDIPDDPTLAPPKGLEDGVGTGLSIAFDIYDNGGGEAPSIDVIYNNQTVASAKLPISAIMTGDEYAHTVVHLSNEGTVDVVYRGEVIHNSVLVPGFTSISGARYAFAGRTGGSSADQWVDNIEITPNTTPGPVRIATQPSAQTVLAGKTATFSAEVNDATGATYQWFRNGTAIAGATSASYTTAATTTADNGALYKLEITRNGTVVTSTEVPLTVVDLTPPANPTLSFNFDDGTIPTGTQVYGAGTGLDGNPWLPRVDTGALQLTEAANGETGAFITEPLLGGAEVAALQLAFDLRLGGGTTPPADGFSVNFAPDLPANAGPASEDGVGTGISLGFDIYDNGNETPPAPSVELKYKGALLASRHLTTEQIETGDAFRTVLFRVAPDGTIDVSYGDEVLFAGIRATNYTFISNGRVGFFARTGGLNENQLIDNVRILATKSTAPLRITEEPADVAVLVGGTVTLNVGISDPNGATYQWSRNGTAIQGATSASFTTPALAAGDDGARYSVRVVGPGGTVTSREAVVSVVQLLTISNPDFAVNFDDGTYPENVTITGTAYLAGDGALHLTDAAEGQGGTIVVTNVQSGPVSGFTLHAKLLVGGGSTPPADGFSVVWGNDVPVDTAFGEDGAGSALVLSFDLYDNGNETPPAPSVDARYKGALVGTVKMSYQEMETGDQFADLFVRIEPDGTLDVQYKNRILFHNVQLPGFTPLTDAAFGIGARTGGANENQWVDDLEIAISTASAPPQVSISKSSTGEISISWTGGGVLQARDSLDAGSAWAPVTGAASPYTVQNDRRMRFFRVAQ